MHGKFTHSLKQFWLWAVFLLVASSSTMAQVSFTGTTPYVQNFDGMGALTALPTNWKVFASSTTPTWAAAANAVTQQASSGTPGTGGTYNWGNTVGTDRSVGAMTSGTFGSPNNYLVWLKNDGTSVANNFLVSYTAKRYRVNSAAASIQFYFSYDGISWTPVTDGDIAAAAFPTGASTYNFTSPMEVNVGLFSVPVNVAIGSSLYLRWNINTTGSNSQGIGIDNVSISAVYGDVKTTVANGDWNAAGTWNFGVPASGDIAIVKHAVYNNSSTGADIIRSAYTLVTVTGTIGTNWSWKSTALTDVYGTFRLDHGGNVDASGSYLPPTYYSGSTLQYNNGGTFNRNAEWGTSTTYGTPGYPCNVSLSNATYLLMDQNGGSTVPRGISGNLTINSGATFDMGAMSAPIDVKGNIVSSGSLKLGSVFLGDIKVGADINFNTGYSFEANGRAVFFTKNGVQNINAVSKPTFNYLVTAAASGATTVVLNTDLDITAPTGGSVIKYNNSGDVIDINGKILTIGIDGSTFNDIIEGSGSFKGSPASKLVLYGSGDIGSLKFLTGFEELYSLRIYRTTGVVAATLGSNLLLHSTEAVSASPALQLGRGFLEIGNYNLSFGIGAKHNIDAPPPGGAGSNSYILTSGTGYVRQYLNSNISTTYFFPIGSLNGYTPLGFAGGGFPFFSTFTASAYASNAYIACRVVPAQHPQLLSATTYLKRYWSFVSSGVTGPSYKPGFTYVTGDVVGTQAVINQNWGQWNGSAWAGPTSMTTVVVSTNQMYPTALSALGTINEFSAGTPFAYTGVYFQSHTSGNWNDVNSWKWKLNAADPWNNPPAPVVPNAQNAALTEIITPHIISIDGSIVTMANAFVRNGGTLKTNNLLSAAVDYDIGGSSTATHLTIEDGGVLSIDVNPPGNALLGSGAALVKTGGMVKVEDGTTGGSDICKIYVDSATSRFYYEDGAVFNWDNATNVLGSSGTVQFFKSNGIPIMRFSKTPEFSFGSSTSAYINGIVEATNNTTLTIANTGIKTIKGGIRGAGKVIHQGGKIILKNAAVLDGSILLSTYNGGLETEAGSTIFVPAGADFKIVGQAEDNIISKGNNAAINILGILDIYNMQIANTSGAINIAATGVLKTANTEGLYGTNAAVATGTLSLAAGSTVYCNKNGSQQISTLAAGSAYHHLVLDSGNIKTAPSTNLLINGNLSRINATSFAHNNGRVSFTGTLSQTYTPDFEFYDVDVTNPVGLSVQSNGGIVNALSFSNGSGKINFGTGNLSLRSSATNTARVGQTASANFGYTGSGRFIVERYIKTPRKWHLLSIPDNDDVATTARANWQEGLSTIAGYGTKITDSTSDAVSVRGFDQQTAGPSVKYFDPAADRYIGIDNTLTFDLSDRSTTAYFNYVYGDRSAGFPTVPTNLRTKGKLYAGTQTSRPIDAGRFDLIGNPYASPVDMRNVTLNGAALSAYYLWDPLLWGWRGVGGYQTLTLIAGNYVISPGGGSYGANGTVNNYLQSGQGFIVKQGLVAGNVVFDEADKADVVATPYKISSGKHLLLSVSVLDDNGNSTIADGAIISIGTGFDKAVNAADIQKLADGDYNMSLLRAGKLLATEQFGETTSRDTFYISLTNFKVGKYALAIDPINMSGEPLQAYLIDNYLHKQYLLSLSDTNVVKYEIEAANTASAAADRFYITFLRYNPVLQNGGTPVLVAVPNPVSGNTLQLQVYNYAQGNYQLAVYNSTGQLMQQEKVQINGSPAFLSLPLKQLAKGSYNVVLTSATGEKETLRVVVL